jgi:hypothetical protein
LDVELGRWINSEVIAMENWGPYYMVPSVCRKSLGGKIRLCESLDADLLRQELITRGLPLEVRRINNPWLYRKKGTGVWSVISESDDVENDFPVDWDISALPNGIYEISGAMRVTLAEGIEEASVDAGPAVREVRIAK